LRFAFLFEKTADFPPSFNNMKSYYVTQELVRRGDAVTWMQLSDKEGVSTTEGILFVKIRVPKVRLVSALVSTFRILIYCLLNEVNLVYIDSWLYLRHSPFRQLTTVLALRIARVQVIVDQRDPYLDFEIARGAVQPGTLKEKLLAVHERAMMFTCSLLIVPSRAYEELLIREGAPVGRVVGFFRGIDFELFNPGVDGNIVRKRLGLEGKFVVGWFGIMHRHLRIREVLIPLAQGIEDIVPNGYVLIGGKGPFADDLRTAKKVSPSTKFDYVGLVPYGELPKYIAACDVILCPVSTDFRFSRYSNWLKIIEGLAVGRPVIATRTEATEKDLKTLRGIVWTGQDFDDFKASIEHAYRTLPQLRAIAREQANHMAEFSISSTIPKIVDRISLTLA
jgi:glycosyltransferase involved in cell wall biosynthesis